MSLDWPAEFGRTANRNRSENRSFEVSLHDAIEDLSDEMDRIGVDDWRLSTAMEHQSRNPKYPYAGQAEPDDPGVVLRWSMNGNQYAVAADAYSRVRDNLRCIGLYVAEKRKMESRPVTTGETEFANARLPAGDDGEIVADPPAHVVLEVSRDATESEIKQAYRERVKETHPDTGGDIEEFRRVERAKEVLLDE